MKIRLGTTFEKMTLLLLLVFHAFSNLGLLTCVASCSSSKSGQLKSEFKFEIHVKIFIGLFLLSFPIYQYQMLFH